MVTCLDGSEMVRHTAGEGPIVDAVVASKVKQLAGWIGIDVNVQKEVVVMKCAPRQPLDAYVFYVDGALNQEYVAGVLTAIAAVVCSFDVTMARDVWMHCSAEERRNLLSFRPEIDKLTALEVAAVARKKHMETECCHV